MQFVCAKHSWYSILSKTAGTMHWNRQESYQGLYFLPKHCLKCNMSSTQFVSVQCSSSICIYLVIWCTFWCGCYLLPDLMMVDKYIVDVKASNPLVDVWQKMHMYAFGWTRQVDWKKVFSSWLVFILCILKPPGSMRHGILECLYSPPFLDERCGC